MRLNEIAAAPGARVKRVRVGRGIGSGLGKTCGSGHKGQLARTGHKSKIGFEGGQMPLQRRLPKYGFSSRKAMLTQEVRIGELNDLGDDVIDLQFLQDCNVITKKIKYVKVILSGELTKAITVKGLALTASVKQLIETQGGKVED